jgi:hypothetical protein
MILLMALMLLLSAIILKLITLGRCQRDTLNLGIIIACSSSSNSNSSS